MGRKLLYNNPLPTLLTLHLSEIICIWLHAGFHSTCELTGSISNKAKTFVKSIGFDDLNHQVDYYCGTQPHIE